MARQDVLTLRGTPVFGGKVSFEVGESKHDDPYVQVKAFQNGKLVYSETHRPDTEFTLGPTPNWQNGAANGEATAMFLTGGTLKEFGKSLTFDITA